MADGNTKKTNFEYLKAVAMVKNLRNQGKVAWIQKENSTEHILIPPEITIQIPSTNPINH